MVGASDLPNETVLQILAIGCDSKFLEDVFCGRYRFPVSDQQYSRGLRRKESAGHASAVCKRWRALVDNTPWFWVTFIALGPDNVENFCERELGMLQQSSQSDLDIYFSVPEPDNLAVRLFVQHLLPLAPRWRAFVGAELTRDHIHLIRDTLNTFRTLPRLSHLALSANWLSSSSLLRTLKINSPRLVSVRLHGISWISHYFPFTRMTCVELSGWKAPSGSRMSAITALEPSSATLRKLVLHFNYTAGDSVDVNSKLVFPVLNEILLSCHQLQHALRLLSSLVVLNLKTLYLQTKDSIERGDPLDSQVIMLPQVTMVSCAMRSSCYASFFTKVAFPSLATCHLAPRRHDFDSGLDYYEAPLFAFPQLKSCSLTWLEFRPKEIMISVFYLQFDFSSVTDLRLELHKGNFADIIPLPSLRNLYTDKTSPLSFLDAPKLRKAVIEPVEEFSWSEDQFECDEPNPTARLVEELQIRPSSKAVLHLSVIARPFINVSILSLDFRSLSLCTSLLSVECGQAVITTLLTPVDNLGEILPNLRSLRIIFPDASGYADVIIVHLLKAFMLQREEAGNPLHSLLVTAMPAEKSECIWFQTHLPEFSKTVFADDDARPASVFLS